MFRRLVLPLTTVAAFAALVATVLPTGADGAERNGLTTPDTYFFKRSGTVSMPVAGSVQIYGAEVEVQAPIEGDLLVMGGVVRFGPGGRVGGNVIHAASRIEGAEGRVSGKVYPLASLEGAAGALTKTAIVASLLLVWLLAAVVVTLMSGREVRHSSGEVRSSALHCFVLGLVAVTSFVLTAIAFSYLVPYVVGIPLLAGLGVFAILTKVYGMIAVFHAVGSVVAGARTRAQLERRRWLRGDLALVVVGALLLGLVRLVPVVGTFVWAIAGIFGIGAALATRFGRREPWFLAERVSY